MSALVLLAVALAFGDPQPVKTATPSTTPTPTTASQEARYLHKFAQAAMKNNDFATAESKLAEAARLLPDNALIRYNLGVVQQKLGRSEDAGASLRQAIKLGLDAADLEDAETLLAEIDYKSTRKRAPLPDNPRLGYFYNFRANSSAREDASFLRGTMSFAESLTPIRAEEQTPLLPPCLRVDRNCGSIEAYYIGNRKKLADEMVSRQLDAFVFIDCSIFQVCDGCKPSMGGNIAATVSVVTRQGTVATEFDQRTQETGDIRGSACAAVVPKVLDVWRELRDKDQAE